MKKGAVIIRFGFTTKFSGGRMELHNCPTIADSHKGGIDITSEGYGQGALTPINSKI